MPSRDYVCPVHCGVGLAQDGAWKPENNCFGIKATDDDYQYCLTKEYLNGEWTKKKLAFETYPRLNACFAAHVRLPRSGVYAPAWQRYRGDHNLDTYIRGIGDHYATDPGYAAKISNSPTALT